MKSIGSFSTVSWLQILMSPKITQKLEICGGFLRTPWDFWGFLRNNGNSWGFLEEGAIREYRPMCTSFIEDPCQLKKFLSLLLLLCSQGEENLFCFQYSSNAMLFQFTAALKRCKLEVTEG